MRRLYLLIIISCLYTHLCAQEYQIEEIEEIAYSFFAATTQYAPGVNGNHPIREISSIEAIARDTTNYMYIANTVNSSGWVILSNEKKYPSIIAHGDSGSFFYDEELLPPAFLYVLEQHMDAIDSTRTNEQSNNEIVNDRLFVSANTNYISPIFLKDNYWKQDGNNGVLDCDKVYNKFIPESHDVSCGRALVGCGAVAMAQIMKHWQWPDYSFIKDTIIGGVCLGDDNQRFYDWESMPNQINNATNIYQVNAVAGLLRDCAYGACTVFWGDAGSSATIGDINSALQNVFGYHTNRIYEYNKADTEPILCQEIDINRPILCQAWKTEWTPLSVSIHTFIITGYKKMTQSNNETETLYFINWGWGSGYNGYVNLDFNGYDGNRTFLTEIYPLCNLRADDVSFSNNSMVILPGNNRTYYSTNNITICTNNKFMNVNTNGHLLIKAGNEVRLKKGFHAQTGSNVHIMIESLCHTPNSTSSSAPQRITSRASSLDDTASTTEEEVANNSLENVTDKVIVSTSIYSASGQLIQTITGGQHDATHLPNGMYILQHRMSDGSVRSEKITNNK